MGIPQKHRKLDRRKLDHRKLNHRRLDHRKLAEQCVVMAQAAEADQDKALWLTLAQSWVRLAEHVARGEAPPPEPAEESGDRGEVQPSIVREVC